MLQNILFCVLLMQVFVAEALEQEANVTSQISKPVNVTSGSPATDNPNTLNDIVELHSDELSKNEVMHPIDQIRYLNERNTVSEARRSGSDKVDEAKSLSEELAKHRCVPTAVNIGPCHSCVCTDHGVYSCRTANCSFGEHVQSNFTNQPECEKNMLYNEGSIWCNCNENGLWRSANCRDNFHFMRSKKFTRTHPNLPANYTCGKGSYYAVDCNICECKGDILSIASCTNRTCAYSHLADDCKLGQVLRQPKKMCACSVTGHYIDQLCVTFNNTDNIQKLTKQQLAKLSYEEQSAAIETTGPTDRCKPNTLIYRDCNRCRCTESSELVCTNKLCLDFPTGNSLRSKLEKYAKRKGKVRFETLPEMKDNQQPCTPGKQYKYKCNMCMCSQKGKLSCTTMICLDEFKETESLGELNAKPKKGEKKHQLRKNDGVTKVPQKTHAPKLAGSNESIVEISNKMLRGLLPIIKEGEKCAVGVVYRQSCNICRCTTAETLLCSKMLCMDSQPKKMRNTKKQRNTKTNKNLRSEKIEQPNPKKSIKQKTEKRLGSNGKSRAVKSSFRDGYPRSKKLDYPELPTTKCEPGRIYQKGCQRCFCTNRKIAQCTNRPCNELTGKVRVPKDVYPRVPAKEFKALPELPHQAAKCDRGAVYRIDCNICLCMHNGNLLCNNLLCLALGEVNRITANKFSGKPCDEDSFKDIDPLVDCVKCRCNKKGKSKCEPVSDCTPYRMRRSLHGDLNPVIKPEMVLTEDDTHCTPGAVYKQNCNNCYCQDDRSLRCTRKGCLNYELVEKLKEQREKLLNEQNVPPRPEVAPDTVTSPADPKK